MPEEFREPLYKDQYEQEHLKPSVCKLLLSPNTYCRVQSQLLRPCQDSASKSTRLPGDNSALLQFLIKAGCCPKVQGKEVSGEDLNVAPIKTVCVLSVGLPRVGAIPLPKPTPKMWPDPKPPNPHLSVVPVKWCLNSCLMSHLLSKS